MIAPKIKDGTLICVKQEELTFLIQNKRKDHFSLWIPVPKDTIMVVINSLKFCGDWRFYTQELKEKIDPETFKRNKLTLYNIMNPVTECVEFLYNNKFIYLDFDSANEYLANNWIEILKTNTEYSNDKL